MSRPFAPLSMDIEVRAERISRVREYRRLLRCLDRDLADLCQDAVRLNEIESDQDKQNAAA